MALEHLEPKTLPMDQAMCWDHHLKVHVSDIVVDGATLSGTTNRKGSGTAINIKFLNVKLYNIDNQIIIDQHYCDQDKPFQKQMKKSAVKVKDVLYQNIKGTSSSTSAMMFDCDIKETNGKDVGATCDNVHSSKEIKFPSSKLQKEREARSKPSAEMVFGPGIKSDLDT
ncbi:Polygalacturonase [Bienertia sinuspersici]